ncbi:MAG: Asp23/Gls24 family envelope stress response protein [Clostridiales Family XIII bacterium]|jgi:uncharacterized alkaline shock family protein YloU|nr:Asp23/Gls24 family envelope stress response protein [Clostridiales Family XIII bacterium]
MRIYGLTGKSGSGKSYQAINLCRAKGIESILDDGLFISGNSILSGISAKRQETKIKAIKTALFTDEDHKAKVMAKIEEIAPASILVIGTSEKMIERITDRLELPKPGEMIAIEDITTKDERRIASRERHERGKHVIPAPTFQLKKEFSGYFMHPLRILKDFRGAAVRGTERSVVRPSFSYLGRYSISNKAIADMALAASMNVKGIDSVLKVNVSNEEGGMRIWISVNITYGLKVFDAAMSLQKRIMGELERMTSINVKEVNVDIRGLSKVCG